MPLPETLQFGGIIHQSWHKPRSEAVFAGIYDDQPVVIKSGGAEAVGREEAILQAIDYGGIPKVVGHFENDKRNLLVMSRLPGIPLPQYIGMDSDWSSHRLPLSEAAHIVDNLALCFDALHKADYLYRDLNLGHVIIDRRRTVGLVDLEWCVRSDAQGRALVDSEAGTWETMAHEEFRVGNSITRASNTYTLGTVLLQLATGGNPFHVSTREIQDTEAQRARARRLHQEAFRMRTGSTRLDQLLRVVLHPAPAERLQSVAEFRGALRTLVAA